MELLALGLIVLISMVTVRHYEKRIERLEHRLVLLTSADVEDDDFDPHAWPTGYGEVLRRKAQQSQLVMADLPFNVIDHN